LAWPCVIRAYARGHAGPCHRRRHRRRRRRSALLSLARSLAQAPPPPKSNQTRQDPYYNNNYAPPPPGGDDPYGGGGGRRRSRSRSRDRDRDRDRDRGGDHAPRRRRSPRSRSPARSASPPRRPKRLPPRATKWDRDALGHPAAPQPAAAPPHYDPHQQHQHQHDHQFGAAAVPFSAASLGGPPRNVGASVLGTSAGAMPPASTAAAIVGAAAAAAAAAIGGGAGFAGPLGAAAVPAAPAPYPGAPRGAAAGGSGGGGSIGFSSGGPLPPQGPTHATRHARRLYIGGLAPGVTDASLAAFLHAALAAVGGLCPHPQPPGPTVVSCAVNPKGFSFVELRSVVEASNALALDGAVLEGGAVRVRRPKDYNAALAANMGPALPDSALGLAAIGLGPHSAAGAAAAALRAGVGAEGGHGGGAAAGAAGWPGAGGSGGGGGYLGRTPRAPYGGGGGEDGGGGGGGGGAPPLEPQVGQGPGDPPQRIFIGGLPPTVGEPELREMFSPFGAILHLLPVRDKATGEPKGFAFLTFKDPAVIDLACSTLHGTAFGERSITVTRANNPPRTGAGAVAGALPGPPGAGAAYPPPPAPAPAPAPAPTSRVLVLREAVVAEELADDEEYAEIVEDMRDEGGKYGQLEQVVVPRLAKAEEGAEGAAAGAPAPPPRGVGLVVLVYADAAGAGAAHQALHGRRFGGRTVRAVYLAEEAYARGAYDEEA